MSRADALKQKLARGEVALMLNPDHPSPSLVEYIGGLGVCDAIFVDCEHGMAGPERVQEMCRAARAAGVVPIVRPEANQAWLITRYLDAGAGGVMVPHIHSADDARALVEAVRYARPADHASKLIVAMAESTTALENLGAILEVPGIDVFFIGPGDLSNTLGLAGQRFHPQDKQMVQDAGRQVVAAGKIAGTLVKKDNAREYVDAGFRFLYEHANTLLADGAARFKAALGGA